MSLSFDFGPEGTAAEGYRKVTPADIYQPDKGYGFSNGSQVAAVRREDTPLTGDFCIPFNTSFVADVEDGNYIVTIVMGDACAPTRTTVKTNGERLVLRNASTVEGQYVRERFAVNVRGGKLKLSFKGTAPRVNCLDIAPTREHITLFLAGDSTVTDSSEEGFPFSGWGQMLPVFFKHDVAVANHAKGGRSSKSFISEGRLAPIQEELKEGDFLFIQFGHNDQKWDEERHTDPAASYPEHLRLYIEAARSKKAVPVLLTSVHRRFFEKTGELKNTHGDYLDAVRRLAEEEGIPLIDLAEKSRKLFEEAGPEGTKSIFLWGHPGEWMNYAAGVKDNTHFQESGSLRIAGLVVEGIRENGLQNLVMYLR